MKDKLAGFIVKRRKAVLIFMVVLTTVVSLLMLGVHVNTDMTKYLPDGSSMKAGVELMEAEVPDAVSTHTLRVMVSGLDDEERASLTDKLGELEGVAAVTHAAGDAAYNQDDKALYVVAMDYDYRSVEQHSLESAIADLVASTYPQATTLIADDDANSSDIPLQTLVLALSLLFLILLAMCPSVLESLLFLVTIGCAVVINLGSNIVMGEVSSVTMCIAALLQLVLSMDYSIILMNRYRQELALENAPEGADRPSADQRDAAMRRAVTGAFSAITSSSLTTFVGLLALVFMSFKIGADLGIVLAKGVICSLVCVFTILPALILGCDRAIRATAKPTLHPERAMAGLARFSMRARYVTCVAFALLFAVAYIAQANTGVSYTLAKEDPIAQIFPRTSTVVLVYSNDDEDAVAAHIDEIEGAQGVEAVNAWGNTLGRAYSASELQQVMKEYGDQASDLGMDSSTINIVYSLYASGEDIDSMSKLALLKLYKADAPEDVCLTIPEFLGFVQEKLLPSKAFSTMADEKQKTAVDEMAAQIEDGEAKLRGEHASIMAVTFAGEAGSQEMFSFLDELDAWCVGNLKGEYHLVGDGPMAWEMSRGFHNELALITLLTAGAIYLVVALTFRNLLIPALLVLIVQCGVYLTVLATGLQGYSIYYLALLIVQCILMGATVDYGILFTSNYRHARARMGVAPALESAYVRSIHTVMTSGLIIVLVCGAIAMFGSDPTIGQICQTLSLGAACTIALILVFLPGILATLDRWVAGKGRLYKDTEVVEGADTDRTE